MKPKYLNDKDSWMLGEDIPDIDFFFPQIWLSSFVNEFRYPAGKPYKKILAVYRGYHLWFYFGEKDSRGVGDNLVKKFLKDPNFIKKTNQQIIKTADDLKRYCEKLPQTNLNTYSNKQLWNFYNKHDRLHTVYYQWGWIPVAVDMFHNNLTEKLKQYLRSIDVTEDRLNEYLVVLTQPTKKSLIQIEQEEFLKIAIAIKKDKYHCKLFRDLFKKFREKESLKFGYQTHSQDYEKIFEKSVHNIEDQIKPSIYNLIQKHYEKYFYVSHMWVGQVSSFEYYVKELSKIIGSDINLEVSYKNAKKDFGKSLKKRQAMLKKLNIQENWKAIFDGFGDFMVTKIYRRFAQIYAIYKMEYILLEIAKRLGLSQKEVRFMLPLEVKEALIKNKINKKEIKARTKFCVYYAEKGIDKVFIGQKARQFTKTAKRKVEDVVEINGQTGCIGKAKGAVKKIFRPSDMIKFRKGDILVSIATDPDIVPAMKKAAAIVTEQGGVTSHAAIVSRELGIPCVIGTKIATKVLKDGDIVEVDATRGVVKKINY